MAAAVSGFCLGFGAWLVWMTATWVPGADSLPSHPGVIAKPLVVAALACGALAARAARGQARREDQSVVAVAFIVGLAAVIVSASTVSTA